MVRGYYVLKRKDFENALSDINELYYLAQHSSSDIITLVYYLKSLIENILKDFDESKQMITAEKLIILLINTLGLANFYATKAVQIPKSARTFKTNLIAKKLRKYVKNSVITKYKYFSIGIDYDPKSAHFSWFSSQINHTRDPIIMRANFLIFNSSHTVAQLVFIQ